MKFKQIINEAEYKKFIDKDKIKGAIAGLDYLLNEMYYPPKVKIYKEYRKKIFEILKKAGLPEDLKPLLNKKIPSVSEIFGEIKTPEDVDVWNVRRTLDWLDWVNDMNQKMKNLNFDDAFGGYGWKLEGEVQDSIESMLKSFDKYEKLKEKLYDKLIYGSE